MLTKSPCIFTIFSALTDPRQQAKVDGLRLCLGQVAVAEGSNEITAVPKQISARQRCSRRFLSSAVSVDSV